MREIARVQQGYFPTQDRVVHAVAGLFKLPGMKQGPLVVLDAGCGTSKAIAYLRNAWLTQQPNSNITLLGIESDKSRFQQATELLGSGNVLWSAIEDTTVDNPVSLLWYNPPYDRVRGVGRTENTLFNRVKDWPMRGFGLLLMIVPDYVLADEEVGLAVAVERDYELLGLWRYPEPEYRDFKQCVLLARRRDKALNKTKLTFPRWAAEPTKWPVLRSRRITRTLVVELAQAGAFASSDILPVVREFENPRHPEFSEKNGWNLYQSCTEIMKSQSPARPVDGFKSLNQVLTATFN